MEDHLRVICILHDLSECNRNSVTDFSDKCDSVRVVYSSPTVPCQPSGR